MNKGIYKKYHFELILIFIFALFLCGLRHYLPFVNDLYELQARSIENGRMAIFSASQNTLIFDSTIYHDSIFMSWGILPAIEYIIWSFISFSLLSPSILYYIHLFIIPLLVVKITGKSFGGYITLISPFFLYFLREDISAIDISYIYGLSYLLLSFYLDKKKKYWWARLSLVLTCLCRFGFFPLVIIFLGFKCYRERKYARELLTALITISALFSVNYLKFENIFFWGERFNKFQGEWITILKTLQVDSFQPERLLFSLVDFVRGVFFNFDGEKIFGNSFTISQLDSRLLYILIGTVIILCFLKLLKLKVRKDLFLALFLFELVFSIVFIRFFSYRLLFVSFLLLIFSMEIEVKSSKLAVLVFGVFAVFQILFSPDIKVRENMNREIQYRNEVFNVDYADKSEYVCKDIIDARKYPPQVFDSLFTGFEVKNEKCFVRNPFSLLLNKNRANCKLTVDIKELSCQDLWLKSIMGDHFFRTEGNVCVSLMESDYRGEVILYFMDDFEKKISKKNIYNDIMLKEFKRINMDCVNEY